MTEPTDEQKKAAKLVKQRAGHVIREEIRNAVRKTMTDDGISATAIYAGAQELANEAVTEAVKAATKPQLLEDLIRSVVQQEMERQMGGRQSMANMIKNAIQNEVREYAANFVKNNISVTILDGGPAGGTF